MASNDDDEDMVYLANLANLANLPQSKAKCIITVHSYAMQFHYSLSLWREVSQWVNEWVSEQERECVFFFRNKMDCVGFFLLPSTGWFCMWQGHSTL